MPEILLVLPTQMQTDLKRAANELAQTERPWTPFEEVRARLGAAEKPPGRMWRTRVPWYLYGPLQAVVLRAKDTCWPRQAPRFVHLHETHQRRWEQRSAVERLGDLANA